MAQEQTTLKGVEDNEGAAASTQEEPYWKIAKRGVKLLLNNKQDEAETLFKKYPESTVMFYGYTVSVFMDALMTFEEEKLLLANQTLRETERRCTGPGWFRLTRSKDESDVNYAEQLESQIMRADAEMYLATLTFLQQDITGYFKGGWILRKSWKRYLHTYNEILQLYKKIVGHLPGDDEKLDCSDLDVVSSTTDLQNEPPSTTPMNQSLDETSSDMEILDKNDLLEESSNTLLKDSPLDEASTNRVIHSGYNIPKSHTTYNIQNNDLQNYNESSSSSATMMTKSVSVPSALTKFSHLSYFAPLGNISSYISTSTSLLLSPFNYFGGTPQHVGGRVDEMDKETITRLMCAVSFGYGLLQLGMSLLPPSVLRLTHFLGFQGNRTNGLKNLMFARCGCDMRAPIATLSILWYHTIVRPFFALDGQNVQAGVEISSKLIDRAMTEYSESSLFLFFKGRVSRLKSEIPEAIEAFKSSIENSNQREIKLLGQHEIGWCYMIELDYTNAAKMFACLKSESRWSRSFYTFLSTCTAGANNNISQLGNLTALSKTFSSPTPKGTQLEEFLSRRFKICPATEEALLSREPIFWRLLVYELLYLWNSLPSCNLDNLQGMISDCNEIKNNPSSEPFLGLANLVAGSALCLIKDSTQAILEFRACLESRKYTSFHADDAHVSAFSLYELGNLLIRDPHTKQEGKQCLQQVHSYKDYDFEQRLSVRIHSILKHL